MSRLTQAFNASQGQDDTLEPRRLELSINPEDGSLLTSPLLSVVMAATDGLYNDIYNMAHGVIEVTSAQPAGGADDDEEDNNGASGGQPTPTEASATTNSQQQQLQHQQSSTVVVRKEKMSNLSFAQRRHELAWRLASHGKTLSHVAALTAAAATTNLGNATQASSRALQHARTAWVQADEAQDALYFFHAQLFPARAAPHDVYGALDTIFAGTWLDLPQDMQLTVDRYETSDEKTWPAKEVADRWNMAVRDKLLRGEMGWMKRHSVQVPWKISLRGGIVRLTHGRPKITVSANSTTKYTYPMEAILTVLSTSQPAQWTLLNVECHAQAKTGQSNHQLDTTNRQRFDLHRLCALAMSKEEARAKRLREQQQQQQQQQPPTISVVDSSMSDVDHEHCHGDGSNSIMARPLHALFQVAHIFGLSWQLEILSAQAQSLRKGIWGGTSSSSIVVTPVQFFENRSILGIVSISFWSVDDRYGPPFMGDLQLVEDESSSSSSDLLDGTNSSHHKRISSGDSVSTVSRSINTPSVTNQLTLSVRAEPNVGIRVSLSGAESVMEFATGQPHIRSTIRELLEATSNPFTLSASEALLAATRLCAERKCYAMVQVLPKFLPSWITLSMERGSIAVAARMEYYYGPETVNVVNYHYHQQQVSRDPVILFRLTCDARTGTFSSTFSRSTDLLQYLACNDPRAASDPTALRIAQYSQNRRGGGRGGAVASLASGRAVRDAFEGLSRSMNVLGQRTGVGGGWKDIDDQSASLRQRAIQLACKDVRVSLISCCGMAAVYGLSAVAMSVATGIAPVPDMAGGNLPLMDGIQFVSAPPISILIDQSLVETTSRTADGERTKRAWTEQELLGIGCEIKENGLTLYPISIQVRLDTPTSIPNRIECTLSHFQRGKESMMSPVLIQGDDEEEESVEPATKRSKTTSNPLLAPNGMNSQDLMVEVEYFAAILSNTLAI